MATTFTLTHELDCDADRFWEVFFDVDFTSRLYKEELGFPEWKLESEREEGNQLVRIVRATPRMDVPAAVAKLIGSGFSYVEEGRFDKTAKTYRWNIKPSTLEGKLRNEGTVRCENLGPSKSRRVVEVVLEAKVFGVGGLIEGAVEKGLREGWEKSASSTNRWVKEHPSP